MSLRTRFAGLFVGRVFALMVALGLVFFAWGVGSVIWMTATNQRSSVSPVQLLEAIEAATTVSEEGSVTVAPGVLRRVDKEGVWLQVLDRGGDEVFAHRRPEDVPGHYSPGALVMYRQRPDKIGQASLFTWAGDADKGELTWMLGVQKGRKTPWPQLPGVQPTPTEMAWSLLGMLALGGTVVTGMAVLFGRSLSRPLLHMMEWLGNLAEGRFEEPCDGHGRPASRSGPGGRLRGSFARYREVFCSLDTLTAEMASAADRRERLERSRDEWISGVSHDLKTPLSSVRGYADLLASGYEFTPEEIRGYADVIQDQSAHMLGLLDDLQLTFRLRADALPLAKRRVDAVELLREAVVDLVNDPRSEGRHVVFDEPSGEGEIALEVDAAWFRRALGNLLVNAAVHNPADTTIRASVSRSGDIVTFEVADDGRGMDAETALRLFDRYYRGTSTDEATEGTGLGMAIARQLIEANSGTIEVESAEGQGTRIRVHVAAATT